MNDTSTRTLLINHYNKYPRLTIQDVFKFIHQSSFGCEHLVSSFDVALDRICKEYEACLMVDNELTQPLDGEYHRVSLSYLDRGLSCNTLASLFLLSSKEEPFGKKRLTEKLYVARELIKEGTLPFSLEEFDKSANSWRDCGYNALHHSSIFKESYAPAYRVISSKYIPYLPLLTEIDKLIQRGRAIVAIDGGSGSGKTSLCEMLKIIYDCNIIHMDDFFLQPHQRTKERYSQVGGNIDRERFLEEVLTPLSNNEEINYRPFDCSQMSLAPFINLTPKSLTIIEGVYSMHTAFSGFYDLSVFLDISKELQIERITKRNSPQLAKRFFEEWIPMERTYFSQMQVKERCDVVITV